MTFSLVFSLYPSLPAVQFLPPPFSLQSHPSFPLTLLTNDRVILHFMMSPSPENILLLIPRLALSASSPLGDNNLHSLTTWPPPHASNTPRGTFQCWKGSSTLVILCHLLMQRGFEIFVAAVFALFSSHHCERVDSAFPTRYERFPSLKHRNVKLNIYTLHLACVYMHVSS